MSISINAVIRKDKINTNLCAPINIRLTLKSKSRYIGTNVTIPLEAWDSETQQVNLNYPNAAELQYKINSTRIVYEKKIKRLEALDIEVDFDTLLGAKSKRINCTIADYFRQQVERMKSLGKLGTALKYHCCLNLLSQCNSVKIRFEQVDMNYLRNFETYLLSKGNTSNSVATKFSLFKAVYNRAIADKVFEAKDNPFNSLKVGRYWKPTRKRAINKDDVLKLKELELPNGSSFYLHFARDIFLFSYYTAGMNFKDIGILRYADIQNERVYYARSKTSKEMSCHLIPEAKRIIDKYSYPFSTDDDYIFPILNKSIHISEQQIFNRLHKVLGKVNVSLKTLSTMIGLKTPLTTYVARHTFATVLKRSGVNIAIISESLGHSDLATTQIYLDSFENSQIDEAMQHLL